MGKEFKRLAGAALNLRHDLIPTPSVQKYVRAVLTDKNGASVVPGTLNLTAVNFGVYVETSFAMPSTDQVVARFEVFDDDQYTKPSCDYLGDTDIYELDNLLPTQLPGDEVLEAEVITAEVEAEVTSGFLEAEVITGELEAEIETSQAEAEVDVDEVEANAEQNELEANKNC